MKKIQASYIPEIAFQDAWNLQKMIFEKIKRENYPDTVLFLQHPHTFTLGKTGDMSHLLLNERDLEEEKIYFSKIDRGGDITYHGPGQLVVYPLIRLTDKEKDVHLYLRKLEELIISFLEKYNVSGKRIEGLTGVWVMEQKIAAIGIKVSRWITMHGLALNIATDLGFFSKIVPCGIKDKAVCSLNSLLGTNYMVEDILNNFYTAFQDVFSVDLEFLDIEEIKEDIKL